MVMVTEKTKALYQKALDWLNQKKFENIKARIEPFEEPKTFYRKGDDLAFTPDFSAVRGGKKSFFDIALKEETRRQLAGKWQLMQELADRNGGNLYLFAPTGHKAFAQRVVEDFNIKAQVVSLT